MRSLNNESATQRSKAGAHSRLARQSVRILSAVAVGYALLAGLRTLSEYDLGWQMATGRWILKHHQIPSVDVFSYTAQGQPWIYPVGSALLFYCVYLLGRYALLSWLGAAACAGTVAVLVWRRSLACVVLAILAVPLIAIRTRPRADIFTVVFFAVFLVLLWQQHQTGRARLWLLPILMIFWVNLHLGFVAGLALIGGYALVEALETPWPARREPALGRVRGCWPWLAITFLATLLNPWGWGVWEALLRQEAAMTAQLQWIPEWGPAQLNLTVMAIAMWLRNPGGAFHLMLLIAAVVVPLALWRRQPGAVVLLTGAALLAVRHIRFEALFASVMVIVGGSVLTPAFTALSARIRCPRLGSITSSAGVAICMPLFAAGLACLRSADLVSDRTYLSTTDLGSFGAGLSWWFPERAAAFVEQQSLPGQIFNSYNEGGYLTWRLGPKYSDYIDGRALPFGPELVRENAKLMQVPPDSPEWQREAETYNINTIVIPLGRYNGLHLFPALRQFCASKAWRPVYLDEVAAIFIRARPENEGLIARLQIQCATAPLPAVPSQGNSTEAFNHWANAAAVLQALGRSAEAFNATDRALVIFPDSAFVHFLRGNLFDQARNLDGAEQDYRTSIALEPNGTAWSTLAALYHRAGRFADEIHALELASQLLPYPAPELLALGYAEIAVRRPDKALQAFDQAVARLSPQPGAGGDDIFFANVAHGRAIAWIAQEDVRRAISFAEETVRLRPERAADWLMLADLYNREQRFEDSKRARERAEALTRAGQR
jgi:tetratricopeptide (TPR) repeat protein